MKPAISILLVFVLASLLSCNGKRQDRGACEQRARGGIWATGPEEGAERLRAIEKGMSENTVMESLGPPEGIWGYGSGERAYLYVSFRVVVWFDEEGHVVDSGIWPSTITSVPASESETSELKKVSG
jgi:hypothetical protein